MNKILMLLQSEFPPDIRLEKEIRALSAAGYKVSLLANSYTNAEGKHFPDVDIYRLSTPFKKQKFNKIVNFPLFFNPRFVKKGKELCEKLKPDYIHAHDLPMLPLGLKLGRLYNIPVVFDMHENYPEALKYFNKRGIVNALFKNYRLAKILEKKSLPKADKIIVVINESRDRLIKEGLPADKVHVVSNTVDLETFGTPELDYEIISLYAKKFVILYTGTISPERGLETPVKAMKKIKEKVKDPLLLLVGEGPSLSSLVKIAEEANLGNCVEFVKWQPHDKLGSFLYAADLTIIPQPNNDFINTTIPHKLFEYMSQGKTVIVSDAIPLKRIITETNAGVVFESDNPDDFAKQVIKVYENKLNLGLNGIKAVQNNYNWKVDSAELLKLYSELKESRYT